MKTLSITIATAVALTISACSNEEKPCPVADTAIQSREDSLTRWEQSLIMRERALAERTNGTGIEAPASPGDPQNVQTASQSTMATYKANVGKSNMPAGNDPKVAYKKPRLANPGQYPEASERLLTAKDVEFQTAWGKKVMLNEIYARKGMIFKDEALKKHFAKESWYKGKKVGISPKQLTSIEKQNISFIENHQ